MLWLALALQATVPTLAEVDRLPLDQAVERVLKDKTHRPIVAVEKAPPSYPSVPGEAARDYVEAPVALQRGCERRRWRSMFTPARYLMSVPPSTSADAIILLAVNEIREVVVADAPTCPADGYINLHPRPFLDASKAIDALVRLNDIVAGRVNVDFVCQDETKLGACSDAPSIRRGLSLLTPISLASLDQIVELTFLQNQMLIKVQLDPAYPERVIVEYSIAPPI